MTTPQCRFVHLRVVRGRDEQDSSGGDFFGLYVDLEEIDKRFFQAREVPRPAVAKMEGVPVVRSRSEAVSRLFADLRSTQQRGASRRWLLTHVNLQRYFAFQAAAKACRASDFGMRNYYVLHPGRASGWELVPSDLNAAFGIKGVNPYDIFSRSVAAALADSRSERLQSALDRLPVPRLESALRRTAERIEPLAAADKDRWPRLSPRRSFLSLRSLCDALVQQLQNNRLSAVRKVSAAQAKEVPCRGP